MWDDQVYRAIDRVARDMTDGAPGSDFRARVVARIESPAAHRSSVWRPALAGLVAIVLVGAIVVLWDRVRLEPNATTTPIVARAIAPHAGTLVADLNRPALLESPARVEMTARRAAPAGSDDRMRFIVVSDIDTLTLPPLAVDSIALGALAPEPSLTVDPLETIVPIAVAPLGEGDRR
jgi:hypothetical protein